MLELLYAPFRLFQAAPLAALLPAVLLAIAASLLGGSTRPSRPLAAGRAIAFMAAGCWCLYACWEFFLSQSEPVPNIRIELLLIAPVLLGLTTLATIFLFAAALPRR